jgi:hypothetical protein
MRYRLRTLLILLAVLPPVVAVLSPLVIQWLKQKRLPPPAAAASPTATYFASYTIRPADPGVTENAIRTLLAGTPARIQLDSKNGKLEVWGPPYAHKNVQAIIGELQKQSAPIIITKSSTRTQKPIP